MYAIILAVICIGMGIMSLICHTKKNWPYRKKGYWEWQGCCPLHSEWVKVAAGEVKGRMLVVWVSGIVLISGGILLYLGKWLLLALLLSAFSSLFLGAFTIGDDPIEEIK